MVAWSFAGLCVLALLGVALHEAIRRGRNDPDPPVWRSPTFRSDLAYGVIGNACFAAAFGVALPWTRPDGSTPALVAWAICLLLLHDAYFYWCHRLLHVPWLFRNVHAVHHR